ncbi:MAG: SWIM zinc finger family protein [Candidatus Thermoplasmatota archaeon]|nr:SWIM zinc finger family protein [Candidatus Thermoplasmatota archaeon]
MSRYGYWGYYEPARPKEVKNGIKAKSRSGDIGKTWWSKRWISVLKSFNMGSRLTRGRSYARKGQVISIDIEQGVVEAEVQGTRRRPYSVTIELKVLSGKQWEKVMDVMASRAIFAAKLLSGEMPQNIEEAFEEAKISLFPSRKSDLETECSCPDWANPCKHIAAVYYLLAEQFDEDPFLLFQLRGMGKEEIIKDLRKKREAIRGSTRETTPVPVAIRPISKKRIMDTFWDAGEELGSLSVTIAPPVEDGALLKRYGPPPSELKGLDIVQILKNSYRKAGSAALKRAQDED